MRFTDLTVTCWGGNRYGQADPPDGEFTRVSAGDYYTCGIRADETVSCWGINPVAGIDSPDGEFTAPSHRRFGYLWVANRPDHRLLLAAVWAASPAFTIRRRVHHANGQGRVLLRHRHRPDHHMLARTKGSVLGGC